MIRYLDWSAFHLSDSPCSNALRALIEPWRVNDMLGSSPGTKQPDTAFPQVYEPIRTLFCLWTLLEMFRPLQVADSLKACVLCSQPISKSSSVHRHTPVNE
jgi:hypothetical protein